MALLRKAMEKSPVRDGVCPDPSMSLPNGAQWLARLRFFLVFLILALTTFEWQYLVAERMGAESGGVTLGLSYSIGTFSTVIVLGGLAYFGRSLAITRIPLALLFANSLLSYGVVQFIDRWPWLSDWMFVVTACHASLNLLSLSIEVSAVQLREELSYPRIRVFGSLGYLAAAFMSQLWGGALFPVIIALAVIMLALPFLSQGLNTSAGRLVAPSANRLRAIIWLSLAAFVLWSVSRGFEVMGPIYLRSTTDNGLMWLTVLIISESVLLQWIDRLNSNFVILVAALMWAGVYGLFAYGLSPMTACAALLMAGFNCPAQVVMQSQVGKLFPGMPTAQAALSISGAAGGFVASLFYVWVARQLGESILGYCIVQSLLAVPLLFLCMLQVRRQSTGPSPPIEIAPKTIDSADEGMVSQAA
jgi:hypothetical protein